MRQIQEEKKRKKSESMERKSHRTRSMSKVKLDREAESMQENCASVT